MHSLVQEPGAEEDIPFLLVRESDWRGVAGQLLALQVLYCTVLYCTMLALQRNMKPLFIVWNDPKQLDLGQIFSCSDNNTLTLATERDTAHSKQCSDGKHLYPNGRKYYGTTEKNI